jgi:hypothetical protein
VGILRVKLEKLIPELKVKAEESMVMQKKIELEKKQVDKEREAAGEEAKIAKDQKDKAT